MVDDAVAARSKELSRVSPARRLILALLVAASALQTLHLFRLDPESLILGGHLSDGALLSMRIAENIARGKGETFDTLRPTNGYQPLWVWLITPLFRACDDAMKGAMAAWLVGAVLFHIALGLGLWFLGRQTRSVASWTAVGALLATFPEIKVRTLNGLETPLFLALFVAALAFISWHASSSQGSRLGPWAAVVTGGLLAATFLTRLDSFLLSMVLGAYVLLGEREARLVDRLRFLALAAATEAALVSPYLIRNEVLFGHLMPLSGVVKGWYLAQVAPNLSSYLTSTEWLGPIQLLEEVLFGADVIANHGLLFAALVLFCATVVAAAVWSIRNGSAFAKLWFGYAAAHLLFFVLIHRENREHTNYYFAVEVIGTAALLVLWVARQIESSVMGSRAVWGLATLMLCFGLARTVGPVQQEGSGLRTSRYAAALWARENLPPGTLIGSFWAGTFSFVSQDRVVDLVGLCNSRQFFERYLSRDRVAEYILYRHIGYLGGQFDFLSVGPDGTVAVGQAHRPTWGELGELHTLARLTPRLRVVRQFGNDYFLLEIRDEVQGPARTHKT